MLSDIVVKETDFEIFRASLLSGALDNVRQPTLAELEEDDEEEEMYLDLPTDWQLLDEDPQSSEPQSSEVFDFDSLSSSFQVSFKYADYGDDESGADPNSNLYVDSDFELKDLCRCLLHLKSSHAVIGDRLISTVLGLFATFLPSKNAVEVLLKKKPSMYKTLKCLHNMADLGVNLRCYKVDCCSNGCVPYWKGQAAAIECPTCKVIRHIPPLFMYASVTLFIAFHIHPMNTFIAFHIHAMNTCHCFSYTPYEHFHCFSYTHL